MGAKSKGGGTGRGTGSKGWTRWNKTAKPVKPKFLKGGASGAPDAKGAAGAKSGAVKPSANKSGGSR
ncbi:DUF3934 domain-containing protein [Bacillus sp. FJAT-27264]|uniref:DUF3934 family protein n=1 Tax=Paenibacillus sp. (strain DSM 101736 / FJAT-27264) TaxID=1850362 RepID=UPI000807A924|nr:DUF3934 family protein [Bacillus sp. FJAT-27264]OBZ14475.1 DUF3934 domain-containing protein [Bacillus sp. FJAT-27264]